MIGRPTAPYLRHIREDMRQEPFMMTCGTHRYENTYETIELFQARWPFLTRSAVAHVTAFDVFQRAFLPLGRLASHRRHVVYRLDSCYHAREVSLHAVTAATFGAFTNWRVVRSDADSHRRTACRRAESS